MAKVILEFDLYEDKEAYQDAMNGTKYSASIQEFDNWLRGLVKHNTTKFTEVYEEVRSKLYSICHDNGVKVWE